MKEKVTCTLQKANLASQACWGECWVGCW